MRSLNSTGHRSDFSQLASNADFLARIRKIAGKHLSSAPGSHDWEHTLRVHRLCVKIGPVEGADMLTLEAAAYLHDIGRAAQDSSNGTLCHAARGAEMVAALLPDLPLDEERRQNIVHCVRSHRFRGDGNLPRSIEARVLFDADKLDAIGAVGVARAYLFAGELGACLHNPHIPVKEALPYSRNDTGYREYAVKLSKIKDRMLTGEGKRLARDRHAFMTAFFERFMDEYEGKF